MNHPRTTGPWAILAGALCLVLAVGAFIIAFVEVVRIIMGALV